MTTLDKDILSENLFYNPYQEKKEFGQTYDPNTKWDIGSTWEYDTNITWPNHKKQDSTPKIYREVDEENYIVLTIERLEQEIGGVTKTLLKRIGHWIMTCINCGYKDTMLEFYSKGTANKVDCPKCQSKAVGIHKNEEEKFIKEILRGTDDEEENS